MSGAAESARLRGWLLSALVHGSAVLACLPIFQVRGEADTPPETWQVSLVQVVVPEPVQAGLPEPRQAVPVAQPIIPKQVESPPVPSGPAPEQPVGTGQGNLDVPLAGEGTRGLPQPPTLLGAPSSPVIPIQGAVASLHPARAPAAQTVQHQWLAALSAKLREMRRYPPIARRLGQEGVVTLRVEVSARGDLRKAEVLDSSGFPLLDQAAARLIQEAAAALRGGWELPEDCRLEIPVAYRLEG